MGPVVPDGPAAGAVLVAFTERRARDEVEGLAQALQRVVRSQRGQVGGQVKGAA